MLSTCSEKIYKNMALYSLSYGIGIVGCSGNPYYAIRFNKYLENIGTPIQFPKYSEFLVINNYTLFIMYSKEKIDDSNKYELFACLYYLPVCRTPQKIFLKKGQYFDFKELFKYNDLQFMNKIIIKPHQIDSDRYFNNDVDEESIDIADYNDLKNLYYKYEGESSFEDIIYYHTFVNDNQEERSQECILSIINCYKSCETCDNIGDDYNNNCLECKREEDEVNEEHKYYFIEDDKSKQCTTKALIGLIGDNTENRENYYFDNINKVFKRCYEGCKTCNEGKSSVSHNCEKCDEGNKYYPLGEHFCYLFNQPPEGYYFDKLRSNDDPYYFKVCGLANCAICIQTIINSNSTMPKCNIFVTIA